MAKQIIKPVLLIIISTLAYYLPGQVVDLSSIKLNKLNNEFYRFYSLYTSSLFFLIATYALFLFIETPIQKLPAKMLYLWLVIAEVFTFVNHVLDKILDLEMYRPNTILVILTVFGICAAFVAMRAIKKPKSDEFNPTRTYLIRKTPKTISGIFNYLYNHSGHNCFYQDGKIYGFSYKTGEIIEKQATKRKLDAPGIYYTEIPRIKDIRSLIGKKYNLFTFNCNHLKQYAKT